jgi:hypothetical protein
MTLHRADLAASKKAQEKIDPLAVSSYLKGERDLAGALSLSDEQITALRRQALALFESGRVERAIDVINGLVALGRFHPLDAILLSRCYEKLGRTEEAQAFAAHADRILRALEIEK